MKREREKARQLYAKRSICNNHNELNCSFKFLSLMQKHTCIETEDYERQLALFGENESVSHQEAIKNDKSEYGTD